MYNILNDDCWLQVLQYLELRDQLSLAQTSERMSFVVCTHWKSLKKATLDEDVQNYFLQNPNIMHEFLECCSGSLVRLDLDRVIISLLESWVCYNFKKLIFLNCDNRISDLEQADKDTALMTRLFPAVVHLMLRSKTSGLYLGRWSKMRDLHLLLHGPMYEYILCEAIMQMTTLEGLTFQKDAIGFLSLKQICTQLINLKSLGLIKMRSMPSASNIWKAVAVCKSLKFLNLSHSNLDKKFLDITTEELDKSLSSYSPSSPLVLNAFNTFLQRCPQKDIPMFNHPNLKISFERHVVAITQNYFLKSSPFVNMEVVTSQDSGDMNDQ